MTVPCIVRICELLADIVHTHFLITQWHYMPFDGRNDSVDHMYQTWMAAKNQLESDVSEAAFTAHEAFPLFSQLHFQKKKVIVDSFVANFDVKLDIASSDYPSEQPSLNESDSTDKLLELIGAKMAITYHSLASCRASLWDEIVQALLDAFQSLTLSGSIPLDDFLSMNWAMRTMISLGTEFCGSRSERLQACLQEKSREYYKHVHGTSFYKLKRMVETDTWKNVSIDLEQKGGMVGIIKECIARNARSMESVLKNMAGVQKGLLFTAPPATSDQESSSPNTESVLQFFGKSGNPFHFVATLGHEDAEDSDDSHERESFADNTEEAKCDLTSPIQKTSRRASKSEPAIDDGTSAGLPGEKQNESLDKIQPSPAESNFLAAVFSEEEASKDSKRSRRKSHMSIAMVVAQSSLDGLAACTARYLQTMYMVPDSVPTLFHGLCQLFDYFFCAVFHGFVPLPEQEAFLAATNKMRSPSPDQDQDYDTLRKYLERALSEVVSYVKDAEDENADSPHALWETSPVSSILQQPGVLDGCDKQTFFCLNARIVAAESCWFSATLLQDIQSSIAKLFTETYVSLCEDYVVQFQLAASQLRALVYRSMCPLLVNTASVRAQISDSTNWDFRKLRATETWVKQLSTNCEEVWSFLIHDSEFAEAAPIIREQVWLELCQCAFDLAIDGFSQLKRVSNDGRTNMIRDIEAVQASLDEIHPCRCPRGLVYVDAYLRAGMLAPEEMMLWIQDNHFSYAYRYMHGLAVQTFSSILSFRESRLKDAIEFIDDLYKVSQVDDKKRKTFATLFEKEKKSLSSMLSSVKMGFN